jgi:predicted  nucleic acid-binding Zn-ribbon protein
MRIMVVCLFIFTALSLTFGVMLFNKRELLKGRTQKLETKVIELATQIEETDAAIEEQNMPVYPGRDVSPCTATLIAEPETSTFWKEKYKPAMELQDQKTLDLRRQEKRLALMTYYKIDPLTLKVAVDPQGFPVTDGDGTMQSVLTDLVQRATLQLGRLNETREMLKTTRTELVDTITDLNRVKQDLRKTLNTIVQKDGEIESLKGVIGQKDGEIAGLKQTIQQKDDQIADLNKQIGVFKQEIDVRDTKIKQQQRQIILLEAERAVRVSAIGTADAEEDAEARRVPPGDKGTVASVDKEWKFCVLSLSEQFLKEMLGEQYQLSVPKIHLMIRKPGDKGPFATKIRLMQVDVNKRLGVANIMTDWQQLPVEPGDIVYY